MIIVSLKGGSLSELICDDLDYINKQVKTRIRKTVVEKRTDLPVVDLDVSRAEKSLSLWKAFIHISYPAFEPLLLFVSFLCQLHYSSCKQILPLALFI